MEKVTLINPFEVSQGTDDNFLAAWERAAEYMRRQPGFVSSRLHRALRPDARFRFINVAEWESPQAFQAAAMSDGFRKLGAAAPANYPALYQVVKTI